MGNAEHQTTRWPLTTIPEWLRPRTGHGTQNARREGHGPESVLLSSRRPAQRRREQSQGQTVMNQLYNGLRWGFVKHIGQAISSENRVFHPSARRRVREIQNRRMAEESLQAVSTYHRPVPLTSKGGKKGGRE